MLFEALHVTSADLTPNDVLQMRNGKRLVDSGQAKVDTSNLVVQQSAAGVSLTANDLGQHIVRNLFH